MAAKTISITPIGTCRIVTPLKRGAALCPIRLNTNRIYGFTHTSAEALQQLRYLKGEIGFDPAVLPILFRPGQSEKSRAWQPSPLHIVEISSAKSYCVNGTFVQSNYLIRHFADFFSSPARSREYRSLVRVGDTGRLERFLQSDSAYNLLEKADRDLLASIRFHLQSFEDVREDMTAIADALDRDKVLFVTHVNAMTADGKVVPSRDKLIKWVKRAADEIGVPCFDPTELMLEFGQSRAMQHGGLDLTHFTDAFSDHWYAHVQEKYISSYFAKPGIKSRLMERSGTATLAERIASAVHKEEFLEGSRLIFAAARKNPDDPMLRALRGEVYTAMGDFERAMRDFGTLSGTGEMSTSAASALMRSLYETGAVSEALAIAESLLSEEYESFEIYEVAALCEIKLGRAEEAAKHNKLAFRLNPALYRAATSVLDHYVAARETKKFSAWREEVLEHLASGKNPTLAAALARWAVANTDDGLFTRALSVVARADIAGAEQLVYAANERNMLDGVSAAIVDIDKIPDVPPAIKTGFIKLAQVWAAKSAALSEANRPAEAYALATSCLAILPSNAMARSVERSMVNTIKDQVRSAYATRDYDRVIALCEATGGMIYRRPELASSCALSLLAKGRMTDAMSLAKRVYDLHSGKLDVRALYAHVAATTGDLLLALRHYGEMSQADGEDIARYRVRMNRFLAKAARMGTRHVRALVAEGRFESALELCALLERYTDTKNAIPVERKRIYSALRAKLKMLDNDDESGAEPLRILKLMLSITPEDVSTLKRAALEAMKLQDFPAAIGYWQALDKLSPKLDTTARNLQRCRAILRRQLNKPDNQEAFVA